MTIASLPNFGHRVDARRRPPLDHEIVLDSFAGVGGWGAGEERANGWAIDVAINHDAHAIAAHRINHPATRHFVSDVFEIDPRSVEPGRKFAHCHFSPDCTHHSKARGGAPVSDRVRGLAWIVLAWGYLRRPRVITLENVEEFRHWCPTIESDRGPLADRTRSGETFRAFVGALGSGIPSDIGEDIVAEIKKMVGAWVPIEVLRDGLGYRFEDAILRACDYGAPTIRRRYFLIARCDNRPIVWPTPTHGPDRTPFRTAAECIDFTRPIPSIFLTRSQAKEWGRQHNCPPPKRPLAEKTLRRIAAGVVRFVLNDPQPYIVANHEIVAPVLSRYNGQKSNESRCRRPDEPINTLDTSNRYGLIAPALVSIANYGGNGSPARDPGEPLSTITSHPKGGHHAMVAAFLSKHNGGATGQRCDEPLHTIAGNVNKAVTVAHGVLASHLVKLRGTCKDGQRADEPSPTITGGGTHVGLVAAFLQTYYGNSDNGTKIDSPTPTVTTKDRIGLITVSIAGEQYVIVDICMRMLHPDELLRCQFGEYADGWVLQGTKTQQVAGIGNSVCPHVASAICRANVTVRQIKSDAAKDFETVCAKGGAA